MIVTDRAERLRNHFSLAFEGIALPAAVDPASWATIPDVHDPTGLHRPTGWLPPITSVTPILFLYCPEIILEQTLDLDDELWFDYVCWIEAHFDLHVTAIENLHVTAIEKSPEEVEDRIELTLTELSAASSENALAIRRRAT